MNERDRNNLEFLLSISEPTLKAWYASVTPDDIEYATELLKAYSNELATRVSLCKDDSEISVSQYTKDILQKYTLQNKK